MSHEWSKDPDRLCDAFDNDSLMVSEDGATMDLECFNRLLDLATPAIVAQWEADAAPSEATPAPAAVEREERELLAVKLDIIADIEAGHYGSEDPPELTIADYRTIADALRAPTPPEAEAVREAAVTAYGDAMFDLGALDGGCSDDSYKKAEARASKTRKALLTARAAPSVVEPVALEDVFPFDYVGGGHFRRKGVPAGEKADTLHAMQAVEFVFRALAPITEHTTGGGEP